MLVVVQGLSVTVRSLIYIAMLSQAGLALGGVTPLPQDSTASLRHEAINAEPTSEVTFTGVFAQPDQPNVVVPVIDIAPARGQTSAPAAVPVPPALETGLSAGAAILLVAGVSKFRRVARRGY